MGKVERLGFTVEGCPSVVSDTDFARAQVLLAGGNRKAGRPPRTASEALLRGFAVCAHCGSNMWVQQIGGRYRATYYCCSKREKAPCRHWHRVEKTDAKARVLVAKWLDAHWLYRPAQSYESRPDPEQEIRAAKKELAALDKREENLVRLQGRGLVSVKVGDAQLREIQRERNAASARLSRAKQSKERKAEDEAELEKRTAEVRVLRENIRDDDFEEWRSLLWHMRERARGSVIIFPSTEPAVEITANGDVRVRS